MHKIAASAGWDWIRQGYAVFRKQPGMLLMLMLGYMIGGSVLGFIPFVGPLAIVVLTPVFAALFMQACLIADGGRPIKPEPFRAPLSKPLFPRLAALGGLYLVAATLVLSSSLLVDGGVFLQVATNRLPPTAPEVRDANMGMALLLMLALYLPVAMASFFAAPLILWQKMGVGKALFYSFFAVLRGMRAFLVYFLSWLAIIFLSTQVLALVLGRGMLGMAVLQAFIILVLMIVHCSVYTAYRDIFGLPDAEPGGDGA